MFLSTENPWQQRTNQTWYKNYYFEKEINDQIICRVNDAFSRDLVLNQLYPSFFTFEYNKLCLEGHFTLEQRNRFDQLVPKLFSPATHRTAETYFFQKKIKTFQKKFPKVLQNEIETEEAYKQLIQTKPVYDQTTQNYRIYVQLSNDPIDYQFTFYYLIQEAILYLKLDNSIKTQHDQRHLIVEFDHLGNFQPILDYLKEKLGLKETVSSWYSHCFSLHQLAF